MTAYLKLGVNHYVLDDVVQAVPQQSDEGVLELRRQNDNVVGYVRLAPGDFVTYGAAPKMTAPDQEGNL